MEQYTSLFDEHQAIHDLKHHLPAQGPLKDFVHHNTLHAFQNLKFYKGLRYASELFGYRVSLSLSTYRALFESKKIREEILDKIISEKKGAAKIKEWKEKLLFKQFETSNPPRIGSLRANWKRHYKIDIDSLVHPTLFRILCSYLDQGIAMWNFPVQKKGFLATLKELERVSFTSFFRTERAKKLLLNDNCSIPGLLKILVGDESLFTQYLFDQQFAHQGWSGMVSVIEDQPESLLDKRNISIKELIIFELLLELDALDYQFDTAWEPLCTRIDEKPINLFAEVQPSEIEEVTILWQDALEWTYYDEVLAAIKSEKKERRDFSHKSFQALFCIDDREASLRRYLEKTDSHCETYSTPGFFGVEFYYQPEKGKFYTKLCPAPMNPKYLVKEVGSRQKRKKEVHFTKNTHSLFGGWLISQTLGFWSALRLSINIFRPSTSPATASSFRHMDKFAKLTIENDNPDHLENGLQIGFTVDEMSKRVEELLKSIGLVKDFAPIVYVLGHGSSSVNNPHYAAYDCGACSGKPGSVNARVLCFMANHPEVREKLKTKGIIIPKETQFVGGLHDTCRDEMLFFDEEALTPINLDSHYMNEKTFTKALDLNAKERSRRFDLVNSKRSAEKVHKEIKKRSVSLFEPRPELNHATNALCIIGNRELTDHLFLDRRAFLNSYNYKIDPDGKFLLNILKAAAPVCGGINLEYFFSRVDNQKLGAGSKLPHNVMGLFGVANGIDGDLRPGLPKQMIEVHDPIRLLTIVEHYPEVVLKTLQQSPETYEWFINEWIHLVAINPETQDLYLFRDGKFTIYHPIHKSAEYIKDIKKLFETKNENLPVYIIQ